MSSTEIAVSPTKKLSKQKMDQIVSSGVTNGCSLMDNIECSDGNNDDESLNEQTLITNLSETNKDCHADASMEPLLIQDCVEEFSTNPINEHNCVFSDDDGHDLMDMNETQQEDDIVEESPTDQGGGGGGFMKSNLSLNLNEILNDDKNMPKNKKFLESSDDQIINQIFFSTITVTPTTDEDMLDSKFLSSDNTPLTPTEVDDPDLLVGPVDFFNRKIDEDETFDTTFTDTADNYQENDGNLCSLNDNFNENYCSFSSIDYNTNGQQQQLDEESPENLNELLQPENFHVNYAEQMRQQRPSIVIDCYDSDSNSDKHSKVEEVNDYCFYFDQTIEEDDDEQDDCYELNGGAENSEGVNSNENDLLEGEMEDFATKENVKVLDEQDIDECFDTEEDIFNEEAEDEEMLDECDDKSLASDEGVINESCLSVNSAVESLESETTVVKKSVKKSAKSSKTVSKKKTISTTESSSITSSKAESFENSFSNGSIEVVEQRSVKSQQTVHQESTTSSKSIDSSSGKETIEAVQDPVEKPALENGEKKKLNGKKKTKSGKKKSDEKENISVTASLPGSVKLNHTQNSIHNEVFDDVKTEDTDCSGADVANNNLANRKFIMSSSLQLHEDDLSRIDVKSLKQKYSNAIEKQSTKSSAVTMNGSSYFGISKDFSVKHLCRSFGDLTSLNSEEYNSNHFQHVYRDSYCSLMGSNNTHQQPPHSLTLHKRANNTIKASKKRKAIKLGIKQFDMRSSFSKFDALQKKNMQNLQNGRGDSNGHNPELEKKCHACTKVVFQMEQVKAEKKFWHKNCFRCSECSKQLNVDTYQSHEGILYCKPHFKTLFAPKAVEESNEPVKPRKLEMIIRESQPVELPPGVARSSDKTDLGLEELQQLNVRQRFQVFENAGQQETKHELDKSSSVKRSTSILSKLARFQAKGMDVGVVDDSLNGICYEHSSSEEEEEYDDDENQEDIELIRAKRAQKEKPISFKEMHDIKSKFESGQLQQKEERREERKQELQNIRSRLFMGKQAKIKEMYQQAVADSEQTITASGKKSEIDMSDKTKSMKERFEKGELFEDGDNKSTFKDEELSVFEQGIGKQSRSLFLELDASAARSPIQQSPSSATLNRQTPRQISQMLVSSDDIVRADSKVDDVQIETADIVSKFKFFETYKPSEKEKKKFRITPPRDGVEKLPSPESDVYRDPLLARNDVKNEQDEILGLAEKSCTTSKMLSMFREMEGHKEQRPVGPKPLKRFTPPPDSNRRVTPNDDSGPEYSDNEDDEEEECEEEMSESEEELDPNYVKSSHKNVDEFLKAAQSAERAKQLREKFEKWEKNEIKKEMNSSSVNLYEPTTDADEGQMETAKSLRARFEQMQQEEPKLPNARVKVNRFV